jgi:hypothetical protein
MGGLLLTLVLPASGQNMEFAQLLTGKEVPLTLKLKELNSEWRSLSIGGSDDKNEMNMLQQLMQMGMMSEIGKDKGKAPGGNDPMTAMLGMQMLGGMFGGMFGGGSAPVYYTQGRTVGLGGETFLVTYRYKQPEMNFLQLAMQADQKKAEQPDFAKMMEAGNRREVSRQYMAVTQTISGGGRTERNGALL